MCILYLSPSLRAKYGTSDLRNAVHGSDSFSSAEREIKFMFPNCELNTHIEYLLFFSTCDYFYFIEGNPFNTSSYIDNDNLS